MDATAALVDAARQAEPGGDYQCLDYARLIAADLARKVDLVACNFSLFSAEELDPLLHPHTGHPASL